MGEKPTVDRVAPALLAMLQRVSTATLSSQLYRRGFRQLVMENVAPLRPDLTMAGQAVTLRYIPARDDLIGGGEIDNCTNKQRIAVESVGPGDVLVIDDRGDRRAGTLGNILMERIRQRGAAGVVTDGAFRDTPAIRAMAFPSYAGGQHPNLSFTIHHPFEINGPIACGGVAVLPGDVIVGDAEAVLVIPRTIVEEVAHGANDQERQEAFMLTKIRSGRSILGVYPPDASTMSAYEAWQHAHEEQTER